MTRIGLTRVRPWWTLAIITLCVLVAGGTGSLLGPGPSPKATAWDAALIKPFWAPPNWLFGPAWTILFILMSVAVWRVWRTADSPARTTALRAFGLQFVLNIAWTPIFFGAQAIGLALLELTAFWCALAWTLRCFAKVDRKALQLMYPYMAWVTFAYALNAAIWYLNR